MNFSTIYNLLKGIAALGGLVAFASFAYTYSKDVAVRDAEVEGQQTARAEEWQSVAIYRLVQQSGIEGLAFEEIVAGVSSALIQGRNFDEINPEVATNDQVLRGIVELSAKSAIVLGSDWKYRVLVQPSFLIGADVLAARDQEITNRLLLHVEQNPDKFTLSELEGWMVREFEINRIDAKRLIVPLSSPGPWGPPFIGPERFEPGQDFRTLRIRILQ